VKQCVQWLSKLSAAATNSTKTDAADVATTTMVFPPPNTRTVTSVIAALSKQESPEAAQEAETWFLRMQDWQPDFGRDCAPNVVTLNALLTCWARVGNGPRAEYILREYQHHFAGPSSCRWQQQGSRRDGHEYDDDDDEDGPHAPNLVSYNAVIRANQQNITKVEDLLQELIAIGLTPNESTMTLAKKALYYNDYDHNHHGVDADAKWKEWERRFFYSVTTTQDTKGRHRNHSKGHPRRHTA
jgi:Pentatricopeptide repeat domain